MLGTLKVVYDIDSSYLTRCINLYNVLVLPLLQQPPVLTTKWFVLTRLESIHFGDVVETMDLSITCHVQKYKLRAT